MGIVPIRHVLGVLDRDDPADFSRVEDPLDGAVEGRITKDMADLEQTAASLARRDEPLAFGLARGHRLFEQDGISRFESGEGGFGVLIVGGGDQDEIGESGLFEDFPSLGETGLLGEAEAPGEGGSASGVAIGDGHDRAEIGILEQEGDVGMGASIPRADHDPGRPIRFSPQTHIGTVACSESVRRVRYPPSDALDSGRSRSVRRLFRL